MENNIEEMLKKEVQKNIEIKIDKLIEDEINDFTKKLLMRKDDYIAEIMRGIRILHEKNHFNNCINYKIIFENIVYLKENK